MEIGIFARTFERSSLDEVLASVAEHGIASVHFNMACTGLAPLPGKIDEAICRSVREAFRRHDLKMAGVSGTFNAVHPDRDRRREMTRRCRLLIEHAPGMGTNLVTLCTGSRDAANKWRWHDDNATDRAWDDLVDTLKLLLPTAETAGVVLGIEPETANVIYSASRARRLLDEIGSAYLKIVMDGANLFTRDNLPQMRSVLEDAFALLGPDIISVHAKDIVSDGSGTCQAAGTGVLDYEAYFEFIKRSGYDGPVVLHNLGESQVDQAAAYVKRHAARLHLKLAGGRAEP